MDEQKLARAVAEFSRAQISKALELIADKGIVPAKRPGVWVCVSSDGSTRYFAQHSDCTCPAGAKSRPCYHRAAARMMNIAKAA